MEAQKSGHYVFSCQSLLLSTVVLNDTIFVAYKLFAWQWLMHIVSIIVHIAFAGIGGFEGGKARQTHFLLPLP